MSEPLLYPYQRSWVADTARFKVGMFARQCGKTFATTLEVVLDMLAAEARGLRDKWLILSRGQRQADEAMREGVRLHLGAMGAAFSGSSYEVESKYFADTKALAREVRFPGGSRIITLPAAPDTARGFTGNVLLDEFAFHQHSREIWRAVFPVVSAGRKLRVISTPNGKANKFYELMTSEGSPFSRHVTDIYQAVTDGLPRDIDELRAGLGDDDAWRQEYELQWLDEASAWLGYDLINSVEDPAAGIPGEYRGGPCFLGNDIGRRRDLWVTWVLEQVGDVFWTREVSELPRAKFSEHDAETDRLLRAYDVRRLCMDQTGMGEKPVEDAQRRHGASRVEGVLFTAPSKLEMATGGKKRFQDREVRIPMGDRDIRDDLHSLRKVTTAAGNVRFDADRTKKGHADRAWALLLALHAAGGPAPAYEYRPVPSSRRQPAAYRGDFMRPPPDQDLPRISNRGRKWRHGAL